MLFTCNIVSAGLAVQTTGGRQQTMQTEVMAGRSGEQSVGQCRRPQRDSENSVPPKKSLCHTSWSGADLLQAGIVPQVPVSFCENVGMLNWDSTFLGPGRNILLTSQIWPVAHGIH